MEEALSHVTNEPALALCAFLALALTLTVIVPVRQVVVALVVSHCKAQLSMV